MTVRGDRLLEKGQPVALCDGQRVPQLLLGHWPQDHRDDDRHDREIEAPHDDAEAAEQQGLGFHHDASP